MNLYIIYFGAGDMGVGSRPPSGLSISRVVYWAIDFKYELLLLLRAPVTINRSTKHTRISCVYSNLERSTVTLLKIRPLMTFLGLTR